MTLILKWIAGCVYGLCVIYILSDHFRMFTIRTNQRSILQLANQREHLQSNQREHLQSNQREHLQSNQREHLQSNPREHLQSNTREHLQSEKSNKQIILLVTFGRSGSSFTSSLIRAHPGVFYFFEPLHSLFYKYMNKDLDRKYDFHVWGDDRQTEAMTLMESFLTCDLRDPLTLNTTLFHIRNDTMGMCRCLENKTLSGWEHLSCYLSMVDACKTRGITLAKTVHFRLKWAEPLLQKYEHFKVIYLVRDPRAVLHSQARVWQSWFNWRTDLPEVAPRYCSSLAEDVTNYKRLKELYTSRVMLARYEDGAQRPHHYTRRIYRFLNLEYTDAIQEHVNSLTSPGYFSEGVLPPGYDNKDYSVNREDPVAAMQKWRWRGSTDAERVAVIDGACGGLYPDLGYRKVESRRDLKSKQTLVLNKTRL